MQTQQKQLQNLTKQQHDIAQRDALISPEEAKSYAEAVTSLHVFARK